MTYETIASFAQTGSLIWAMLIFAGAVAYALWPSNRAKFDRAARAPLQKDETP